MCVAQPPHRSSSSFFSSRWRKGIGRASMVSAVDAPRCGESTSSPGASGTKQSDGVQSGCTPWMAALFSGPPLILVGRQLRPFSSSARAMRDVPSILQLGSSPCIGLERRRWRRPSKEQHKAVPRAVPKVHGAEASTERTERNDRSGVGTGMPVRMMRTRLERGRPRGLLPRNDTAPDRCRGWSPTAG